MHQMTPSANSNRVAVLYTAFELGDKEWKLGFSNGSKQRLKTVEALNTSQVLEEIGNTKEKLGLAKDCPMISQVRWAPPTLSDANHGIRSLFVPRIWFELFDD